MNTHEGHTYNDREERGRNDQTRAVPKALVQANARKSKPPGLIKLVSTFWRNKDFRRGLAAFNDLLEMFGRNLAAKVPEQK